MSLKELTKSEWKSYFDAFSTHFLKDKQPEYAEIRVLSKETGAQPETSWVPLEGITYNPREDLLNVRVRELNKMIWHPEKIYVDEEEDGWVTAMQIVEANGTRDIIEIR